MVKRQVMAGLVAGLSLLALSKGMAGQGESREVSDARKAIISHALSQMGVGQTEQVNIGDFRVAITYQAPALVNGSTCQWFSYTFVLEDQNRSGQVYACQKGSGGWRITNKKAITAPEAELVTVAEAPPEAEPAPDLVEAPPVEPEPAYGKSRPAQIKPRSKGVVGKPSRATPLERRLQAGLLALGYMKGPPGGTWDAESRAVLVAYLADVGLSPSPDASSAALARMDRTLAAQTAAEQAARGSCTATRSSDAVACIG